MEYMLLRDGSVKAFDSLFGQDDVVDALGDYDGVAYYWHSARNRWACINLEIAEGNSQLIDLKDVPDVIKLAAMLE